MPKAIDCNNAVDQTLLEEIKDDGTKHTEVEPIVGSQLIRKYLLNRCKEIFERGQATQGTITISKVIEDEAAAEKMMEKGKWCYILKEYYTTQKANSLVKFMGKLLKQQMLMERIMYECVNNPFMNREEEDQKLLLNLIRVTAPYNTLFGFTVVALIFGMT
ncbi:hypothetical protein EDD18DRAFT_1107720 [Armillaria luteobubalina]|uniref:Uncharacterized protein n=1 Tax=Armillaria luteobubalina TaxID=153913 RepID=A0AA39UM33_9AGAR|nr:hypothetical protein EDD18DRAFT_1107720 [Armillaria luteobubalina]